MTMNFQIITKLSDLGNFIDELNKSSVIGLDVETSSLNTRTCKIYSLQLNLGESIFVFDLFKFNKLDYVCQLIQNKILVGHNVIFDAKVIYSKTKILFPNMYDTMLAEILIHNGMGTKYPALDDLVFFYTGETLDKSLRESFYKNGELIELSQEQLVYSALDVKYLLTIREKQIVELTKQKQDKVLDMEMKLTPIVTLIESLGVLIDREHWTELMKMSSLRLAELKNEVQDVLIANIQFHKFKNLGEIIETIKIPTKITKFREIKDITVPAVYFDFLKENINLNSHGQMKNLLGLSGIETKSVGAKILKDKETKYPIITSIIKYGEYAKKDSSYGQTFLDKIDSDGYIHCELHQLSTDSGRFAPKDPNLNQVPNDEQDSYKKGFIAPENYDIVGADYSNEELRLVGVISREPKFIDAFQKDLDLHIFTASQVLKVDFEAVSKLQRKLGKTLNFAILYGTTAYGISYNFKMSVDEGQELLDKFFSTYPVLKVAIDKLRNKIWEHKYANTLTGRRRYFEEPAFYLDVRARDKYEQKVKREGFNHIIQGTGADILKLAQINLFNSNPFDKDILNPINFNIRLPVHDELVTYAHKKISKDAEIFVKEGMEKIERIYLGGIIPAKVDSYIASYWIKNTEVEELN